MPLTVERLHAKSRRLTDPGPRGVPCLEWTGGATKTPRNPRGYGKIDSGGVPYLTHRVAYALQVGPIPDGYEVDHLCCNTLCMEPAHLEAVTPAENKRRTHARGNGRNQNDDKARCPRDHPYDVVRTRGDGRTFRACRTCEREAQARHKARKTVA